MGFRQEGLDLTVPAAGDLKDWRPVEILRELGGLQCGGGDDELEVLPEPGHVPRGVAWDVCTNGP